MPRIDNYLVGTAWGDLHEDTKEYVKHNMIDVAKTYDFNQENDYLEEHGEILYPVAFLKNGMYILVDRADVWHCNVGAGVDIEFDDDQYFERI